jgi:dienelactone hydrolase
MRAGFSLAVLLSTLGFLAGPPRPAQPASAHFELMRDDVLLDEPIPIIVSGLTPAAAVTVHLHGGVNDAWTSSATFTADRDGRIDLTRMPPVKGSYHDVDAMGLFWSAERNQRSPAPATDEEEGTPPDRWTLTAEVGGAVVARASVRRRAVAADVGVSPVHSDGLVGMFYEPAGPGRHPAMLVLSGSGGGTPPASNHAGGLASRGYAVLALAYFGVEGLPRSLSNIPIEYFGTALQWLERQPSVDPKRIGVLGGSRGAELALLVGVAYPEVRTVVAYMPSNVVWRGCCDPSAVVAWTASGRPIAAMSGRGMRGNALDAERAEIQVEAIRGAILLVSGKDDGVWDSAPMAERILARLRRNRFPYPFESLTYDHAGHAIARPYASTMNLNGRRHPLTGRVIQLGGTPAGTAHASEDSWKKMLAFVDRNLRGLDSHAGR